MTDEEAHGSECTPDVWYMSSSSTWPFQLARCQTFVVDNAGNKNKIMT